MGFVVEHGLVKLAQQPTARDITRQLGKPCSRHRAVPWINFIEGILPGSWVAMINLAELDLSNNALTGTLPDAWGAAFAFQSLSLQGNRLTGTIPSSWFLWTDGSLNVERNHLDRMPIPSIATATLKSLYLYGNPFYGTLPESYGLQLTGFSLGGTQELTGTFLPLGYVSPEPHGGQYHGLCSEWYIAEAWANWATTYHTIKLINNHLEGTLPASWSRMSPTISDLTATISAVHCLPSGWHAKPFGSLVRPIMPCHGTLAASWARIAIRQHSQRFHTTSSLEPSNGVGDKLVRHLQETPCTVSCNATRCVFEADDPMRRNLCWDVGILYNCFDERQPPLRTSSADSVGLDDQVELD